MASMPTPVAELLDRALVGELTVVDADGRPVTYPLIPLYDGEHLYMTSSTLFSRKLEHIDANAKVAVSITDPVSVGGRTDRRHDPGRREDHRRRPARRLGAAPADLGGQGAVDRVLPERRVALPLFFERALIEITPRRVLYWSDGSAAKAPEVSRPGPGRPRDDAIADDRNTPELDARAGLDKLATYPYQIATWVDDAGYPVSVAVEATIDPRRRPRTFPSPAGLTVPTDRPVSLTGSHIRPQPGLRLRRAAPRDGVGPRTAGPGGSVTLTGRSAWGWDEAEVAVLRILRAVVAQSRQLLRCPVGGAWDAG